MSWDREKEMQELEKVASELGDKFPGAVLGEDRFRGDMVLRIDRDRIHDVLSYLKVRGFEMLLDIAAVDCLRLGREERFEVIYILYSIRGNLRLRLKVLVPESDPVLPSATDLWKAANWAEREAFDMMGIRFDGHPNLVRILTHHEFEGHALRKDYPIMRGQWCSDTRDMREDLERDRF